MLPKVTNPDILNISPTSAGLPIPATAALYSPIGIDSAANLFDYDEIFNQYSSDSDIWLNGIDEYDSPLSFDASENGLWNGNFVPPPPRPPFLDDSAVPDGLTTCDLCTWAWHDRNAFSLDGSINETTAELGWTFTLIIVSIISALVGAVIMVIVLRLRRLKTTTSNGLRHQYWWNRNNRESSVASSRTNAQIKQSAENIRNSTSVHNDAGICTWINNRRSSRNIDQMEPQITLPAENHYTPMDDAYSPAGNEALYAELDRESIRSANPSYQNTAYSQCGELDQDVPIVSSAPSSAYYSDLSTTGTVTADRAYEVVGLTHLSSPITNWEQQSENNDSAGRRVSRLAAINESSNTIPSDYV